jgi:hypothetical protein
MRGARGGCANLNPGRAQGAQLDRVGRGDRGEQLSLAVPDDEPAVETEVELDPPAGIAAPWVWRRSPSCGIRSRRLRCRAGRRRRGPASPAPLSKQWEARPADLDSLVLGKLVSKGTTS